MFSRSRIIVTPPRSGGWAVLYCFCTSAADPVIGSPSHNPVMLKRVFTNAFKSDSLTD